MDNIIAIDKDNGDTCNGLFVRCTVSNFVDSDGSIQYRTKYRVLKKMSCSKMDCSMCDYQWWEECQDIEGDEFCDSVTLPRNPKHFAIYRAVYIPDSPDRDGIVDGWEWKLEEYEELCDPERGENA